MENLVPFTEGPSSVKRQKFFNSAKSELERLKFLHERDGETGALQFASRTYHGYGNATKRGLEYRLHSKTSKSPYAGYGLEYRYQLLGSRFILRKFLKSKKVAYV